MSPFTFATTPRIVCQQGGATRLADLVTQLDGRRTFIVTDRGLVDAGLLSPALTPLESAGIDVVLCSDVQADPPEEVVLDAVHRCQASGADVVVGFGGGSSMDTAKLVALLAKGQQSLPAIYGIDLAKGPRLPLIQIPTTAGTGSEVTPIAIVTTPSHEKKGVVSNLLYPDVALLDSELTLGLPPAVTAMTGIDAMVHAIEAFTGRHKKNPLSDTFALKALQLLHANLERVIEDGRDAGARERMLLGSLMAGIAFANSPVGAVHALAYPLGGHYQLPHGLANALMLVPTLRFNLPSATSLYAELGRVILPGSADRDDAAVARRFIDEMDRLGAKMPLARNLRAAGVREADLDALATDAMNVQRLLTNNPRDVTHTDALALYRAAY